VRIAASIQKGEPMSESVWPTEGVNVIHEHVTTTHTPVTLDPGQLYRIIGSLVERSTIFGDAVTYTHIVQPVTLGKAVHDMMEQNSKPEPFNAGGDAPQYFREPDTRTDVEKRVDGLFEGGVA
jgi:hypothetical protein